MTDEVPTSDESLRTAAILLSLSKPDSPLPTHKQTFKLRHFAVPAEVAHRARLPHSAGAMTSLILASSSPRRLALLAQIGVVPSRVTSPDIDESPLKGELPRVYALRLAEAKARAVVRRDGEVVLAGDTTVAVGRRILPPAETAAVQRELLALLSGRRQQVISAVAVVDGDGKLRSRLSISTLTFKRLTAAEIDAYVACGEGLGKAGGYAIQGRAAAYTRALSGSYSGVVGLPLFETAALLRASGVDVA